MRPARLAVVAMLALPTAAHAHKTRLLLTIEAGPEYDSNVNRIEPDGTEAKVASPLFRLTTTARATRRAGENHAFDLTLNGGARLFLEDAARENDVGVVQGQGTWLYRTKSGLIVGALAQHYEAFERTTHIPGAGTGDPDISRDRDFRMSGADGQLIFLRGPDHRVLARAGYRWFGYKPDQQFDFQGDTYALEYQGHRDELDADGNVDAEYDWHLGYALARRDYASDVLVSPCPPGQTTVCLPERRDEQRRDLYHSLSIGGSYTGPIRGALEYQLNWTDSNSYGQSVLRHVGVLTLTKDLPWRLFATVRGELQLLQFSDPLMVDRLAGQSFESIEDENRSSILVQFERALDRRERLHAVARYTLQTTPGFPLWRQLAFAGLAWSME